MDWTAIPLERFQTFFLVFVRVATFLIASPLLAARQIPPQAKIAFTLLVSLLLVPALHPSLPLLMGSNAVFSFWTLLVEQILIGLILGFASFIVFVGIQLAGQIIDLQMGFGLANIVDPLANIQQTVMGQMQYLIAIMLFMAIDGHHQMILAISSSFTLLPLGPVTLAGPITRHLSQMAGSLFVIAFQVGFPTIAALFLTDVALGFIARMVPQMNVLLIGFPLKIFVGFIGVSIALSIYISLYPRYFEEMIKNLMIVIQLAR